MRLPPALTTLLERPAEERRLGPFRLLEPLGKGGFAPVWLAEEVYGATRLRTAALKLFAVGEHERDADSGGSGRTSEPTRRDRIVEEARALCSVEHPNVVRFYSLVSDERAGVVGLAMEHVQGEPLDAILTNDSKRSGLPIVEILEIGIAVASALAVVHQAGLVHRDVKPANVVRAHGVYKLIDFGIASADRPRPPRTERARTVVINHVPLEAIGTRASEVLRIPGAVDDSDEADASVSGTVGYINPECMPPSMAAAGTASDIYGLGALLYECASGWVPAVWAARAANEEGLSMKVLVGTEPSPALSSVRAGVPPALGALIDAMLSVNRAKRPRSAEAVARELERMRGELAGRARPLPSEDIGPFRGLARFEESDRDVYFGRSAEVAAAIELLRTRGLVALIGASGSGKSSLARAGVAPQVVDGALGRWPKAWDCAVLVPGNNPSGALATALEPYLAGAPITDPEATRAALAERAQTTGRGLVLLIDQLEELVTVSTASSRDVVAALLARLGTEAIPGLRVVVTARRDLLDALLALSPDLARVLTRGALLVSPMTEITWADVLDQALTAYGYALEDEALRTALLSELRETASAMPLVQFALTQLWLQRNENRKLVTHAGLAAMGGILGALDRHAEATLTKLTAKDPEAAGATQSVMLALTTAQGTRVHRPRAKLVGELGAPAGRVLDAFEDARLLIAEPDGYTLAHETLLTHWARLRAWLSEARADRLLADELARDAERWRGSRDATLLLRRRRLVSAQDLARIGRIRLPELTTEFIAASRADELRFRVLVAAVVLLTVVIGSVATLGYVGRIRAAERLAVNNAAEAKRNEQLAQEKEREAVAAKEKTEEEKRNTEKEKTKVKELADTSQKALANLTSAIAETKACKQLLDVRALPKTGAKQICKEVPGCPTCAPVCTTVGTGKTTEIE